MTHAPAESGKIKWQTPVLTEDSISDSTEHHSPFPGLDNYESSNPVHYGVT